MEDIFPALIIKAKSQLNKKRKILGRLGRKLFEVFYVWRKNR